MDIDKMYVTGTQKRVFINPMLGCNSGCSYCYLPNIGLNKNIICSDLTKIINVINEKEKIGEFLPGEDGTIISFGCYSECWKKEIRQLTKEALFYFIERGNYIQIATKEYIEETDIAELNQGLKFRNQLTVFVSLPCVTSAELLEPYAEKVENRIRTFIYNHKYNIDIVLYIKPILKDITIQNIHIYTELIRKYNLKVVVGSYLQTKPLQDGIRTTVGKTEMWSKKTTQQTILMKQLESITKVYSSSIQVIEEYKMMRE